MTKCNNLRYKAKIDGNEDYGRICVENAATGLAFLCSDREGGYVVVWHCDAPEIEGWDSSRKVTNFEIVPRDPETYRDWQVGDTIYNLDDEGNTVSGEDEMCRVIFRSGELVAIAENYSAEEADINGCYTCSELHRLGYRLVLTDIEQQIIEKKKKYEPQDGDVCFVRTDAGNCFIFIKREHKPDEEIHSYACFDTNLWSLCSAKVSCVCDRQSIRELRPATDEEKQLLFDAMAKEGKRWNAEKKVVEDIPKPYEFKKGEPVLVKDVGGKWRIGVFIQRENSFYGYRTRPADGIGEIGYCYCLPYNERTMHLLGTSEDYKEEQR